MFDLFVAYAPQINYFLIVIENPEQEQYAAT
jgi:hypothetical protein